MADLLISGEFLEGITRDQLLSLIRDPKADPTLLEHIVSQPVVDEELWRLVLHHPATTPAAMAKIARAATLPILKELAGDRALLSRSPQIPHAILDNPAATEDEIAVVEAVLHEQARGATEEETKKSLFAIIKEMTVGQKLTPGAEAPPVQLTLFTPLNHEVVRRVAEADLDQLRPLDALNLLAELKRQIS